MARTPTSIASRRIQVRSACVSAVPGGSAVNGRERGRGKAGCALWRALAVRETLAPAQRGWPPRPSHSATKKLGTRHALTHTHARATHTAPSPQSELREWLTTPPDGCTLLPPREGEDPSLSEWVISMAGPPGSLYAGEDFRLRVRFDGQYPLEPPEVVFLPPPPVHEHIYSNGHCCLDTLYTGRNVSV